MGPGVEGSTLLGNISVNCSVVQGNRLPVVGTQSFTAAQLTAMTNNKRGDRAFCHDASATTFASIVSGGGSNWVPVVFNGNSWIIG